MYKPCEHDENLQDSKVKVNGKKTQINETFLRQKNMNIWKTTEIKYMPLVLLFLNFILLSNFMLFVCLNVVFSTPVYVTTMVFSKK